MKRKGKLAGIGIDAVDMKRAERFVRAHAPRVGSFFLPQELRFFRESRRSAAAFALLFAAKEACSKAVGVSVTHPHAFRRFAIRLRSRRGRASPKAGRPRAVPGHECVFCFGEIPPLGAVWLSPRGRPRRGIRFLLRPFRFGGSLGVLAIAYRLGIG